MKYSIINILNILIYGFLPITAFIIGLSISKKRNIEIIDKIIKIIVVIEFLISIGQLYSPILRKITLNIFSNYDKYAEKFEIGSPRVVGSIGNPNTFALFLFILLILLMNGFENKAKFRFLDIIICLICIYNIILTKSRTIFILMITYLCLYIIISKIKIKLKVLFLLILICFTSLNTIQINNVFGRIDKTSIQSMGNRKEIWNSALESKNKSEFELILGDSKLTSERFTKTTDNYYITIFIIYGSIGVLIYLINNIIILFYINKYIHVKYRLGLIISLIVIFISDITGTFNRNIKIEMFIFLLIGYLTVNGKSEKFNEVEYENFNNW
ncbi:O-antigen ligase family protein [Clostridium baratii]|uniref:O-antigen ligase family protein n=1 Tax=Clostridium baratii TaxID=1561 RepID=UPI0011859CA6|nr:O-antigen ligase family protein [Clostridium baratii]